MPSRVGAGFELHCAKIGIQKRSPLRQMACCGALQMRCHKCLTRPETPCLRCKSICTVQRKHCKTWERPGGPSATLHSERVKEAGTPDPNPTEVLHAVTGLTIAASGPVATGHHVLAEDGNPAYAGPSILSRIGQCPRLDGPDPEH